jgi:hypothetical protein
LRRSWSDGLRGFEIDQIVNCQAVSSRRLGAILGYVGLDQTLLIDIACVVSDSRPRKAIHRDSPDFVDTTGTWGASPETGALSASFTIYKATAY